MLTHFNTPVLEVPSTWLDVETTGRNPRTDRVVQIGIVRFERGAETIGFGSYVNPGRPIPAEATAIHGITDEMVRTAPTLDAVLAVPVVQQLLANAQPGAYHGSFDRAFVPELFGDADWPHLDALSLIRVVDRFVSGKGRHQLGASCQRHGIEIGTAHSALDDARAAGKLFYTLAAGAIADASVKGKLPKAPTLGEYLKWQQWCDLFEWFRFNEWRSKAPPGAVV